MRQVLKRAARKIYRILLADPQPADAGQPEHGNNIIKGDNVQINNTAILVCHDNATIEFEGNNYIGRQVELGTGQHIFVGKGTTIQDRCVLLGNLEIGRYCIFSMNVYVSSGNHYYDHKPQFYIQDQDDMVRNDDRLWEAHTSKKVIIEDDCFIGYNAVVMSGITIGKGSVIGANSVVTKDVAPYSVMAGAPARLLKKRLEFVPQHMLAYDNDVHLPYFYKGFLVNVKQLFTDREKGGIGTLSRFTVCLNGEAGQKLRITASLTSGHEAMLHYHGQAKMITAEMTELAFDIDQVNYHHFEIKPVADYNVNDMHLLVRSVAAE